MKTHSGEKEKKLIKKVNLLVDAHKRCENLLKQNKDIEKWNLLHDLKARIYERFLNAEDTYLDFHWAEYGFNVYNR